MLGGIALVLACWLGGPPLLRHIGFFRLRRVEFAGLRYLSADTLMPAVRLAPEASLFDRIDGVERRLRAIPGVQQVRVHRRIPGTLRVDVVETEPVALVPQARGMAMVDDRGRTLPFDPAISAPDLPVVPRADSIVAGALARVRDLDPAFFAKISTAWQVKGDVVLEIDSRRYWVRSNPTAEAVYALTAVAEDLARKHAHYTELDGRFAQQIVVRGMGA